MFISQLDINDRTARITFSIFSCVVGGAAGQLIRKPRVVDLEFSPNS
jgi:hypothetical protein